MPRLTVNLFSGGLHAGGIVPIQDCLVAPVAAGSVDEALSTTYAVFQSAAALIRERYGMRLLRADEGGLSPDFREAEEMLALAVESIERAGFRPGAEVALTVDVAASHFYKDGKYFLRDRPFTGPQMIEVLDDWLSKYPIVSIEDGLAQDDWPHWPQLLARSAGRAAIMGDDLLCTNPARIRRAVEMEAANALLLKVNQVGTLLEAAEALQLAKNNGWTVTVSARSGETEDDWLADLAVGWGGDFIKIGSITQSERLAKYNRLLEIERELSG
jgi:enolase